MMKKRRLTLGLLFALGACKNESPIEVPAPLVRVAPAPAAPVAIAPIAAAPVTAAPVVVAAARPSTGAPIVVSGVSLGTAVGADHKVTTASTRFGVHDTIYAAIDTQHAAPDATLAAKWTRDNGQMVFEHTAMMSPDGDATTNFKLSSDSAWPPGKYLVEISLNGVSAKTVAFEIK